MERHDFTRIIHANEYINGWEVLLLVSSTVLFSWGVSAGLLYLGIILPLLRYPLMVIFTYLFYLLLLSFYTKIWLNRIDDIISPDRNSVAVKKDKSTSGWGSIDLPFDVDGILGVVLLLVVVFTAVISFWIVIATIDELLASELLTLFLFKRMKRFRVAYNFSSLVKTTLYPASVILILYCVLSVIMIVFFPEVHTIGGFVKHLIYVLKSGK